MQIARSLLAISATELSFRVAEYFRGSRFNPYDDPFSTFLVHALEKGHFNEVSDRLLHIDSLIHRNLAIEAIVLGLLAQKRTDEALKWANELRPEGISPREFGDRHRHAILAEAWVKANNKERALAIVALTANEMEKDVLHKVLAVAFFSGRAA